MKTKTLIPLVIFLTVGCADKLPQNAEAFRQAPPGRYKGFHETYDVDRSLTDIDRIFRKFAPVCFDRKLMGNRLTSSVAGHRYTSTVLTGQDTVELHIQEKVLQDDASGFGEPENGHYLMVVDAARIDDATTRIDLYGPATGHEAMVRAVRNWTEGKNLVCPDLR